MRFRIVQVVLRREVTHKWDQPAALYWLVVCCSMAAAVQGMDESVINGANLFFTDQFGLTSDPNDLSRDLIHGLVLGAPYLCCATVACWINDPLNRLLGRRGVIFLTAWISAISCIWQGFTNSWQHLFVARFFLFVNFVSFCRAQLLTLYAQGLRNRTKVRDDPSLLRRKW